MTHHTYTTDQKAPGVINAEGLDANTANDLNSAGGTRFGKAIATQVAELAIKGHAAHQLKDGGFLVCKYGHTFHAKSLEELQAFARRLGVSQ